jgi:hypothetical protein
MARGLIGTINDEIASGGTITGDLTVEGDLTISGSSTSSNYDEVIDGHVQVTSTNKLKFGGSTSTDSDSYILESSADVLDVYVGAVKLLSMTEAGGGASDKVSIPALTPLYLDGGGNSYIAETAGDTVKIVTGGSNSLTVTATTTTVLGDLTISGDDLTMATNTSGAALIADGSNFNPVVISGDVVIATNGVATIQANSVALTTDTTGNYVATITGGTSITSTANTTGEGTTHSLSVDDVFVRNDGNDTTSGVITSAGYKLNLADGGGDVTVAFQQGGTTSYIMGLDDSVTGNLFKIHSATALADTSDFTLDASGNVTINGDLTVTGGDITLGTSLIFSGGNTTSLNLIDAIDATTEATIEAAIDTLANLTSVQGNTLTLAGNFVTQNNNVTINAAGAARTLTLTESLTIGDGNDGTITFSGASKTLTVEDNSTVNQDLSSDASPTFADLTLSGGDITLTGAATDIDLIDNTASALSFDASGAAGILEIVTTNSSEGVKMANTLTVTGALVVGSSGSGSNVTFYSGAASSVGFVWDEDGGTSSNGALALGANDHGVDFKVFGDAASKYMEWDSSADTLTVAGTIATADLVLNNDRGHYLIVEEEDYLSIKNEKTGKLYKFVLEEIDGS